MATPTRDQIKPRSKGGTHNKALAKAGIPPARFGDQVLNRVEVVG